MLYDVNYNYRYDFDNGGEGSNFKISQKLYQGYTYYFAVKLYLNTATGSFPVKLESNQFQVSSSQQRVMVMPGEGTTLSVSVTAKDSNGITYSWSDQNGKIEGADSTSYIIPVVKEYQRYYCTINDNYGNSQTVYFSVQINNNFNAMAVPVSQKVELGQTATLEVSVSGTDLSKVTYEWRDINYNLMEGATTNIFITPAIENSTRYDCIVQDGYGSNYYLNK